MTQEQKEMITKQDIIDYINKMEIKKSGIGGGGLDKVDVYSHIQQIVTMYDAYLKKELKNQKAELAGHNKRELEEHKAALEAENAEERDGLVGQIENLSRFKELASNLREECDAQKRAIDEQKEELEKCKKDMAQLEEECAKLKEESDTLKDAGSVTDFSPEAIRDYTNRINKLNEELRERASETEHLRARLRTVEGELADKIQEFEKVNDNVPKQLLASSSSYNYSDDISEILRESRAEGQRIIDEARRESEKELVKMLNLRAKFKHENEVYRNWCSRVDAEKKAIEEFFANLSAQYKTVNRALATVKEDADSFDIERVFTVIDSGGQDKIEKSEDA
jgi:DNA repair exonuclease SbcCD ATPase subunit